MRQIVLDTETTGLEPAQGHRIIEIGGVEIIDRRITGAHFHYYLNPEREIDAGALAVHGISNEFLEDKPKFADVADEFIAFVRDAELIIHNAPFDVGFLDHELSLLAPKKKGVRTFCKVLDTLALARQKHPGQKNNLDALCKRYEIDNSNRQLHGALLDSQILAEVYLAMTGGQTSLQLQSGINPEDAVSTISNSIKRLSKDRVPLKVIKANEEERRLHEERLVQIKQQAGLCLWSQWAEHQAAEDRP